MTGVAAEQELYRACRIIFGQDLAVSREFLEYIQRSGVKSAFRKKAMETHPDRLAGQDELTRRRGVRTFLSVRNAYEQLSRYLDAREKGFRFQGRRPSVVDPYGGMANNNVRPPASSWQRRPTANSANAAGRQTYSSFDARVFSRGIVPERPLLFGQYLYYAGRITWQDLNRALLWQRAQRPRMGEIARQRGWLGRQDILLILGSAAGSARLFGERALYHRLLTRGQVQLLLLEQKRLHRRVGEFFVLQRIMTRQELQILLARFARHNALHGKPRRFSTK